MPEMCLRNIVIWPTQYRHNYVRNSNGINNNMSWMYQNVSQLKGEGRGPRYSQSSGKNGKAPIRVVPLAHVFVDHLSLGKCPRIIKNTIVLQFLESCRFDASVMDFVDEKYFTWKRRGEQIGIHRCTPGIPWTYCWWRPKEVWAWSEICVSVNSTR